MMGLMVTTKVCPPASIPPTPLTISPGSPKHLQQRPPRIRRTPPRLHQNYQRLNPNPNRSNQHPGHQPRQNARSPNPRYARNRYALHRPNPQTHIPLTPTNPTPDLADYLVRKGVPFRETHHISGQVVALAESKNLPMDQLSHADLQSVDKRLGSDFIFDYEKSVEMRTASGGTVSAIFFFSYALP